MCILPPAVSTENPIQNLSYDRRSGYHYSMPSCCSHGVPRPRSVLVIWYISFTLFSPEVCASNRDYPKRGVAHRAQLRALWCARHTAHRPTAPWCTHQQVLQPSSNRKTHEGQRTIVQIPRPSVRQLLLSAAPAAALRLRLLSGEIHMCVPYRHGDPQLLLIDQAILVHVGPAHHPVSLFFLHLRASNHAVAMPWAQRTQANWQRQAAAGKDSGREGSSARGRVGSIKGRPRRCK